MLRGILLSVALLVVGLGSSAAAATQSVNLMNVTVTGDQFGGWHIHVPTKGLVMVTTTAISTKTAGVSTWFIRTSDYQSSGAFTSSQPAAAGFAGQSLGSPIPTINNGNGEVLDPGDYVVAAMAGGGAESIATVQVTVPPDATVLNPVSGPAWNLDEQDFADPNTPYLVGPNLDDRSVHGRVTLQATHTLFAQGTPCAGTTISISGPSGPVPPPFSTSVGYGEPGAWTFGVDLNYSTPSLGGLGVPCTVRFLVLDLALPGAVPPPV